MYSTDEVGGLVWHSLAWMLSTHEEHTLWEDEGGHIRVVLPCHHAGNSVAIAKQSGILVILILTRGQVSSPTARHIRQAQHPWDLPSGPLLASEHAFAVDL